MKNVILFAYNNLFKALKKIADKLDILLPKWYNECT